MNKILALALVFSLAFNIAFVGIWAYSRTLPFQAEPEPTTLTPALLNELRLTQPQRANLQRQRERLREELTEAREELAHRREELFNLLENQPQNGEAIHRARQRVDEAQERLQRMVVDHMRELRTVLTPEQHRRLMQMVREYSERRGRAHMAPRPGRGQHMRRRMPAPEAPRDGHSVHGVPRQP